MKNTINVILITFALFLSLLTSCTEKGCTDPYAANFDFNAEKDDGTCIRPTLTLDFQQKLGEEDFAIGQEYLFGKDSSSITFTLFQFYLSGFMIRDIDGLGYGLDDVYLLVKSERPQNNVGSIRAGRARTLHFNLGIDPATNSVDSLTFALWPPNHPLGLQTPSMYGPSGYIFFKIEGTIDFDKDGIPDQDFIYHVGTNDMLRSITLIPNKNIVALDETFLINVDMAKILEGINFTSSAHWSTDLTSNPSLSKKLADNFSNAFSM